MPRGIPFHFLLHSGGLAAIMQHSPSRLGSLSYTIESSRKHVNHRDFNTLFEINASAGKQALWHTPRFRLLCARNDPHSHAEIAVWRDFTAHSKLPPRNSCSRTKIETCSINASTCHLFARKRDLQLPREKIINFIISVNTRSVIERS